MAVDRIGVLRKAPLFSGLEAQELEVLAQRAVEQRLRKGEILFLSGDPARGLWIIVEGAIRAYRVRTDGREQVIHVERAGATIGDMPLFDEGTYPSNTAGEEDTILLFLARADVQRAFLEHPRIAMGALKVLAARLRKCASLVETLSLDDVDRRLARLLLIEGRERGIRANHGLELDFGLTHQQVASRIGSVREVVSRAFSRLQGGGFIRTEGRRIYIADEQALARFVEGE